MLKVRIGNLIKRCPMRTTHRAFFIVEKFVMPWVLNIAVLTTVVGSVKTATIVVIHL